MRGGSWRLGRAPSHRGPRPAAILLGAALFAGLVLVLMGGREVGSDLVTELRYQQARGAHSTTDAKSTSGETDREWCSTNQVAWLNVAGTPIDYPVAQGTKQDPEFYLTHDLWGQRAQVGCPYLDWRGGIDSAHALIYGHRVGTTNLQFSPIAESWNQDTFDAIGTATLDTQQGTQFYTPCFALKVDKSYEHIQRFSMTQDELRTWLEKMLGEASATNPQAHVLCQRATKALTLATCASSQAGQRERTLLVFVKASA